MKLSSIVNRSTDFGTLTARRDFISFTLKVFIYIIPAIILGHLTDKTIKQIKDKDRIGKHLIYYILLQTLFNIFTLYLFILLAPAFLSEFQSTMPGVYFITLYFGLQTNYHSMLKQYMNTIM